MNNKVDIQEMINRWRKRWIFSLYEFSHICFQKKLWIDTAYPDIIGSFGEDICQYFDDLFLDDNYKYQLENGYISIEEYQSIKHFHELLVEYDKKGNNDSAILNDSTWIEITRIGLFSWNELKLHIKDSNEIRFINEIEQKY